MNILVNNEDNWVIASFDEDVSLEYTPALCAHAPINAFYSGYDNDNSKIVEGVTLPEDYVDLKYCYDSESETWSENETYASWEETPEVGEHDPNPADAEELLGR